MKALAGGGKTQNAVTLNEAKNPSLFVLIAKSKRDSSLRSEGQNKSFFPQSTVQPGPLI